jgi:TonB family protein
MRWSECVMRLRFPTHRGVAWLLRTAALLGAAAGAAADPTIAPRSSGQMREDAMPAGVAYDVRVAEIRRRIQDVLVYPPLARRREVEGESQVAFEIAPGGRPAAIELVQSSGSSLLDRAAERAVRDAAPLPPVLGRLRVPVRFALDAGPDTPESPPERRP